MNYNCPAAGSCGGCTLLNMSYPEQLALKQQRMERLLGGFCRIEPIVPADEPLHCRCKLNAAVAPSRRGLIAGTYAAGSHRIVDNSTCLTEDEGAKAALNRLLDVLRSFKVPGYDEDTGRGLLRHIQLRKGKYTGELMAILVTASPVLPGAKALARAVRERVPEITTLIQNVNARRTSQVLGGSSRVLFGPGFIRERIGERVYRLSPGAFFQVNPAQTVKLYDTALEFAALTGSETVVDAYCGVGTIGLYLAPQAGRVLGVELNRDAVTDARANARLNGAGNARFTAADATEYLALMAARGERADVVVLDPPRSGSTGEFLKSAAALGPERIVYISCGPDTLARDLGVLKALGYQAETIRPVDMFPMTEHTECAALIKKT